MHFNAHNSVFLQSKSSLHSKNVFHLKAKHNQHAPAVQIWTLKPAFRPCKTDKILRISIFYFTAGTKYQQNRQYPDYGYCRKRGIELNDIQKISQKMFPSETQSLP